MLQLNIVWHRCHLQYVIFQKYGEECIISPLVLETQTLLLWAWLGTWVETWNRLIPHLWQILVVWDIVSHISQSATEWVMHVRVLECEYAHECSGACIPLCAVSVCVSGCCGRGTDSEREREREREREGKKDRAVGEVRRGKLKLHDEYIGAQSPDRERQSEHRYTVSKQTVRSRGDFPMDAGLGCWTPEHTWIHTQAASLHLESCEQPLQNTNKLSHTHAYILYKNT